MMSPDPINLLHSPPTEDRIAAILVSTAGRPALPRFGAEEWTAARKNIAISSWLTPLTIRALAEAEKPMPVLTNKLYAHFFSSGERLPFEKIYFERRRRLSRAAISLLLDDGTARDRLLASFLAKLGKIMAETSWALPAHVWTKPDGKDPMQIDLFAAETANNLAELLVVFAAVIPAPLARRIQTRLRVQFFENYANRQPAFHWSSMPMNWNAVCHQGVLGAALTVETDHRLVARMLAKASLGLPHYLDGFGEDGSTSEGPGYWSYGFGWFSELNAQLEHRTQSNLSLFADHPKVARIARFAPQMAFSNGNLVNFSDGEHKGRLSPALLSYLGRRFSDPILTAQGAALFRHHASHGINLDAMRCDFFHLTRLALRTPSIETIPSVAEVVQPDAYFPDYGAIVARGEDAKGNLWEFAAKGGHNDEHHNHNDCGSWMLNINGHPALIEIGAPEYTREFFSDQRYTFLAARSLGHSVPFVNGCEQSAGRAFAATVLNAHVGGSRVEFTVDLTRCYPPEARCKKLHRTWLFEKTSGHLSVTDTYELDGPGVIESMLISQNPVIHGPAGAFVSTMKNTLLVTPSSHTVLTTVETCDYHDHAGSNQKIHRLRYTTASTPSRAGQIGCELRLVEKNADAPRSSSAALPVSNCDYLLATSGTL